MALSHYCVSQYNNLNTIMLQCGKAAAYMCTFSRDSGTLDMRSSYAISLAIRRLRW